MGIARTAMLQPFAGVLLLFLCMSAVLAQRPSEVQLSKARASYVAAMELRLEARIFRLPDLGRYESDLPDAAQTVAIRLPALLERTVAAACSPRLLQVTNPARQILVLSCTPTEAAAVRGVLKQLQAEMPLQVRLQCSLVTLPWSVAQAQKLLDGRMVAVDDETVGKLMREASKSKGTICNLPEVTAGPLAPFYVESRRKPDAKETETLRLRGEMLPLDDREVAVAMHLVRGALPADKTREPDGALLAPVFRLQAGKCALATIVQGETATVLVVRCIDVAAKAPPAPVGR